MTTALLLLPEGFEEIEALTPIDLLRRAGVQVTVAALAESIHVTGRSGVTLHADCPLSSVPPEQAFNLLILPGGAGVRHLRADPRVIALVRRQATGPGWLAAICAAPTVLLDANLLAGRRFTAHHSVHHEFKDAISSDPVVIDGHLITSRGAGTALPFGLALVASLCGPDKAREISQAIAA